MRQHTTVGVDVSGDQAKLFIHEIDHCVAGHVFRMAAPDIERVAEVSAFAVVHRRGDVVTVCGGGTLIQMKVWDARGVPAVSGHYGKPMLESCCRDKQIRWGNE